MKRIFIGLISLVMVSFFWTASSQAKTEWQVLKTLEISSKPVDMLISTNNRWIYVLNDQHQLLIYELTGRLKDSIDVGANVDQIKAGPREDLLFLLSRKAGTVQIISVNMIEEIDVQGAPFKGPVDAPVTIAVFSDFQWPYCARLVPVFEQVLEQYPQQVKVVFKQFPLRNHNFAMKAAQATLAAHQQGKFWEFHDQLFKKHNQLSDQTIEEIRSGLSLDAESFKAAMQSPETMARINTDLRDGTTAGVRGTPTVFVNGKLVRDKSFRGIQREIADAVKKLAVKEWGFSVEISEIRLLL